MKRYADLHNHLYGSITAEFLYEIGRSNPSPRWEIFTNSYLQCFGEKISTETFFEDYKDPAAFRGLYQFNHHGPFPEFQAKFNLIIALSRFDREEISRVSSRIVEDQFRQGVSYGEYRIMYSPSETDEGVYEKTLAACEGLALGEQKTDGQAEGKLAVSLHRNGDVFRSYSLLKRLMEKDPLIRKYLVGLDFCYIEEGFPPKEKKEFFEEVNRDNTSSRETALAILYHVGESFQDKSLLSACRWVLESAEWGAHRLGHAISLGIDPSERIRPTVVEPKSERLDQLRLYYDRKEELESYFDVPSRERIGNEIDSLKHREIAELNGGLSHREECLGFQNYCIDRIKRTNAIIESCPSSNEYIGMVRDPASHPILRFARHGLRFTISTDDPGIFGTTIEEEYSKAEKIGLSSEILEEVRRNSFLYVSEILSGRKTAP
ncbi:adenosine deaminase [Leptospira gomenensis]|uniref:adenosine deaminase n=1 Tax=Leptospira gomenensis TaxID=2484974 RepID=A0A5F1Y947_9LEPT|nr:adenosine deaminase [Leptospira gomenensis]TGK32632.1 adenosine deaminase [Leptospira gomenensis]TGK36780.1 adenosine deaminase [Leptospira gomenensis]TGK48814.1 adenosine deaminase [Leptospira gomenensis]TGK64580.1 adenosine deaminase [Leptospira gomenensis]